LLYCSLDSIERGMRCDEEEIKSSSNMLRRARSAIVHRAKRVMKEGNLRGSEVRISIAIAIAALLSLLWRQAESITWQ
jgi:hypothetical protein